MLAPTTKDQEAKRLKAELDEALDMLATLTEALRRLVRPEASGTGSPATTEKGNRDVQTVKECQDWLISEYDLELKRLTAERDKAIEELRRMKRENEMLWIDRLSREQKGWGENG